MTRRRTRFGARGTCIHCERKFEYRKNEDESSATEPLLKCGSDSEYICEECQQQGLSGKPGTQGKYGLVPIRIRSLDEIDFSHPEVIQKLTEVHNKLQQINQTKEMSNFDFSQRSLVWQQSEEGKTWHCYVDENRGSVYPLSNIACWQGCVEVPRQFKRLSEPYYELAAAVSWTEEEVLSASAEARKNSIGTPKHSERLSVATLSTAHRKRLKRFWITPEQLEPATLTYRAEIFVQHKPISFKSIEMSFGEQFLYDDRYPSALQLAHSARLNGNDVVIEHCRRGHYEITSSLTYARYETARDLVFKIKSASLIDHLIRTKTILNVSYGVREVETDYTHWEAWVGDKPPMTIDRSAYMQDKAFELTLCYALDLDGYKACLGSGASILGDDRILQIMHSYRAASAFIPLEARLESEQWLMKRGTKADAHAKHRQ